MVQVDVFWGYGWGASLAAAAGRSLLREEAGRPFQSRFFVLTLVFLSLCWAPTGMLLLLRHPSWETMQVATSFSAMSEWLVLAFGITNVTQGMLGYSIGKRLLAQGRDYAAQLNWLFGYFGMFFILLYGWDGLGYDRFLYDRDMLPGSPAWIPGAATGNIGAMAALWKFLASSVSRTLYIDGAYLLPPFFLLSTHGIRSSQAEERRIEPRSALRLTACYLGAIFAIGLGSAAFCAATVRLVAYLFGITDHIARGLGKAPAATAAHVASYCIGLPLGLYVLRRTVLRVGGPVQRYLQPLVA